jgi:multicomponent Na+:H+ antiporter subunit F
MSHFLYVSIFISLGLLSLSMMLVFIRMLIGPTLPDRVASLDVAAMLVICMIAIFCILANRQIYLDIVLALALISFLSTIAFAQFIEYQLSRDDKAEGN